MWTHVDGINRCSRRAQKHQREGKNRRPLKSEEPAVRCIPGNQISQLSQTSQRACEPRGSAVRRWPPPRGILTSVPPESGQLADENICSTKKNLPRPSPASSPFEAKMQSAHKPATASAGALTSRSNICQLYNIGPLMNSQLKTPQTGAF